MSRPAGDTNGSPPTVGDAFADLLAEGRQPPAKEFGGGTLERRSIAEQVANRIMAMIKSGNLKSGDRLPTEQQMTIAFGISRPPLREALKALTLMGVLESRQGGRYTVTDLSPSRLVAPFNTMLAVADYDVHQQFEARSVVDLELVRLCTERATAEQRQRILKLAIDGHAFEDDPVAFRLLDIEFHQAINDRCRQPPALRPGAGPLRPRPRCPPHRQRDARRHRQERRPAHRRRRSHSRA